MKGPGSDFDTTEVTESSGVISVGPGFHPPPLYGKAGRFNSSKIREREK